MSSCWVARSSCQPCALLSSSKLGWDCCENLASASPRAFLSQLHKNPPRRKGLVHIRLVLTFTVMAPRPLFITFEGLDGSGKSTHLRRASAWLEERSVPHIVTHEPGGTPLGDALRA